MPKYVKTQQRQSRKKSTKAKVVTPILLHNLSSDAISQHLSSLELLPLEIFHLVLPHLDVYGLLSIQFVSSTINAMTKNSAGKALIKYKGSKFGWVQAMCLLERKGFPRKALETLTCYWCGERKAIGMTGFSDQQFKKAANRRSCFDCSYIIMRPAMSSATVHGVKIYNCFGCLK